MENVSWQSSGQWISANDATAWNAEEPIGGKIEMNSVERCWSKNPRRGETQRTSGTSKTSASAMGSTSGTSESGRRRTRTPTHRPSPTPKPSRSPSESSVTSEWSETSVSSDDSWTRNFSAMRRFFDDQRREHHHEGANLGQSCHSARSCFQKTLHDECMIAIREEPNSDQSL